MLQKVSPHILIINPYGIGDALFCTPLIRTLKNYYDRPSITILLGSRTASLFEFNPDINHIFIYDKDKWRSASFHKKISFCLELIKLRFHKFDLMIDLSNTDEYGFWAKFVWKIPLRIGFRYKNRGRYLTHRISLTSFIDHHVVAYYYQLLSLLGIPAAYFEKRLFFFENPKNKNWINKFLKQYAVNENDVCISLLPGGGASWGKKAHYKYWPLEHYNALIQKLTSLPHIKIILIGGPEDRALSHKIVSAVGSHRVINMIGKSSIQELAALLKYSKLVVGTESGPLHLSTALTVPTLFLFGPVDEKVYGPFSNWAHQTTLSLTLPCRPCYKNFSVPECTHRLCLDELSVETVFEKALSMLTGPL